MLYITPYSHSGGTERTLHLGWELLAALSYIYFISLSGRVSFPQVFKMATEGIMLILNDRVFLACCTYTHFVVVATMIPSHSSTVLWGIQTAVTSSSATFMCHPFNKASGQGNSQRGKLAGVLGDMSAGLFQASLADGGRREERWGIRKKEGKKT